MKDKDFIIKNGLLCLYNGKDENIVIPNSVTSICDYAFEGCKGLTSIEIPNSVISIGTSAFKGCENLSNIKIPNSVTSIGYYAFAYCTRLKNIEIPNSVFKICPGTFRFCTNLTSIEIPSSVTYIDTEAFSKCENLMSIEIPNSVKNIGGYAFEGCEKLKSIKIHNSVTTISCGAFDGIQPIKRIKRTDGKLIAYKGFNKGFLRDWTCRGFKYEIGKSYHQDGKIKCCENGFHACTNPLDVFNYYSGILNGLHFAEVELSGEMDWVKDKVAASDIRIIRELTASELADIYNNMEKE